jgi:type IV pilus biogenesis protein CpaD/CtpE
MIRRSLLLIGFVAMGLVSTGCTGSSNFWKDCCPGPTRLEEDFGTSFRLQIANQVLNPEAEKNLEPVTGFDGKAAQATMEKYRKEFEKPAPPAPYVLGLGSLSTRE